jgi:hypothetical protein
LWKCAAPFLFTDYDDLDPQAKDHHNSQQGPAMDLTHGFLLSLKRHRGQSTVPFVVLRAVVESQRGFTPPEPEIDLYQNAPPPSA